MNNNFEYIELNRFYNSIIQDIRSTQLSDEEGGTQEQIFTQWTLDLLGDTGETENARACYDEKALGTKNQHKINGYAISENYETLDLFITIYRGREEIHRISKDEIETAYKRITNLFRKAIYSEYSNDLEESSEIFQFARTLSNSKELKENLVRVNAIVITDGLYSAAARDNLDVSGYPIYYRTIDLEYLSNIAEKSHMPIEINFASEGFNIPCISSPNDNSECESYLAIIPGSTLAIIYERFGARLLEQNVRSFLQFTGKINNGIRRTIMTEPHMFLAFNNGIAATAEQVIIGVDPYSGGHVISAVKDLQIVNGGQTTASIYHTWKKDRADITGIQVQIKLSVIRDRNQLATIVPRIAEYANTQNKVSISDLSSNKPFHIEIEKLSRSIFTPHRNDGSIQTRWFYERTRGQYKNARLKDGFTAGRAKAFDFKNPKSQVFTKEDLAKFENTYREKIDGKKIVSGPFTVVKGNQKNYIQFITQVGDRPDSIYFEDMIAKGLLFRSAEKIYGVKPNSIGDMRYVTVPYSISYLGHKTGYRLDLFKIWRNQSISSELGILLFSLMEKVEAFIKEKAPGSLYGEWAKKEECWKQLRDADLNADFSVISNDLEENRSTNKRKKMSSDDSDEIIIKQETERIRAVNPKTWRRIEEWGTETGNLSEQQKNHCFNLSGRIRSGKQLTNSERSAGLKILDIVVENVPQILFENEENVEVFKEESFEISHDLIDRLLAWDLKNRKLQGFEYQFMSKLRKSGEVISAANIKIATKNVLKAKKYGFRIE